MESKGEEDVEASESFVPSIEVALGHGEGVSEVQSPVHVGEGEGLEEFLLLVRLGRKKLVALPDASCPVLKRDQFIPTCRVLHVWIN